MKSLVAISALMITLSAQAALVDFTDESKADFVGIPWSGVGLVLIQGERKHRTFQSGFFISPTTLVVSASPFSKTQTGGCEKPTYIFSGQYSFAPDYDLKNVQPSHRCKKVMGEDRLRGYAVWQVEPLYEGVKVEPIVLLQDSLVEELHLNPDLETLTYLGYAYGKEGGRLKISSGVKYLKFSGPFADGTVSSDLWDHRWDWSSVATATAAGMQGGPLLIKTRKGWFAAGMSVAKPEAPSVAESLLTANFLRLTRYFGSDLEEEE